MTHNLTQHAQTKKPMNIRKLTYSIDPSVSSELLEAKPLYVDKVT